MEIVFLPMVPFLLTRKTVDLGGLMNVIVPDHRDGAAGELMVGDITLLEMTVELPSLIVQIGPMVGRSVVRLLYRLDLLLRLPQRRLPARMFLYLPEITTGIRLAIQGSQIRLAFTLATTRTLMNLIPEMTSQITGRILTRITKISHLNRSLRMRRSSSQKFTTWLVTRFVLPLRLSSPPPRRSFLGRIETGSLLLRRDCLRHR